LTLTFAAEVRTSNATWEFLLWHQRHARNSFYSIEIREGHKPGWAHA